MLITNRLKIKLQKIFSPNMRHEDATKCGLAPIIVYQMSKVGSRSVFETLKKTLPEAQLFHRHVLDNLDTMEANIKKEFENPVGTLNEIRQGKLLRKKIESDNSKEWLIVTLTRDPLKQTISRFFQVIDEVIPNAKKRYLSNSLEIDEIIDTFFYKLSFSPSLRWFDNQFKPVFDIDIYDYPFPWEKGYMIINKGRFRVLTIRLEDLNQCFQNSIHDFIGIPNVELIHSNLSSEKWYSDLYKTFLAQVSFSDEYLTKIYDSKFTRHFYSSKEIKKFRSQWKKN